MSLESSNSLGNRSGSGSRGRGLGNYAHPFFDPSTSYIPNSVKEMFRWCLYLYTTHSEIAPTINKKCSYVITPLIYESESSYSTRAWRELLERNIKLREAEYKLLLDNEVYGNAFASIYRPFDRHLICKHCGHKFMARTHKDWKYRDNRFEGHCPECKTQNKDFEVYDRPVKNRKRTKIIRWNPKYIDVRYNPFSDSSTYIYRIPQWLRKRVQDANSNRDLILETPMSILKATKEKKNVKLDPDNIYHFKNPSVSMEDDAFGLPPLLPVFKDAWLFQTYRRAQEAIALDHVLPLTVLTPSAPAGGPSPHMAADLGDWSDKMMNIIQKWRRDQNGIYTMPFPAQMLNIRGDAQALNVHNDMTMVREQITGGLDTPQEFVYGGLNWTGSSISLRVLENIFLNKIEQLDNFLKDFVIPRLTRWCGMPPIHLRHRDFKMADDAQQKQIALSLRQTNTLSDQTTIEELGFDFERENTRKQKEEIERLAVMERQQLQAAKVQGQASVIQAEYAAKAQVAQQKALEADIREAREQGYIAEYAPKGDPNAQTGGGDPYQGGTPNGAPSGAPDQSAAAGAPQQGQQPGDTSWQADPQMLDTMSDNMLKTIPPNMIEHEIAVLQQTNPALAAAIRRRQRLIQDQVNDIKPLPEQKPPRRENSPV